MSQRVLITGGAGFIGSHMANRLLSLGHDVTIIDNESTGLRQNVPSAAHYIKGDIGDPTALATAFAQEPDTVFHIAGQASTIRSFADPVDDLNVNIVGTVAVLQQCLAHRVPRLLYASSMTAYGHPVTIPVPETNPCDPVSYYGITKYAAERYVHTTSNRLDLDFDFNVTSFRMFNVYGPGQRLDNPYQGVMGIFIGNVLRNEPIIIHGDGTQSRDFVHIDDVVAAWLTAWQSSQAYGQVFNLGIGRSVAINDLVDTVLATFGHTRESYPVRYEPLRPGDQKHMTADIGKAQQMLGWQPQVGFAAGVAQTADWARTILKAN